MRSSKLFPVVIEEENVKKGAMVAKIKKHQGKTKVEEEKAEDEEE